MGEFQALWRGQEQADNDAGQKIDSRHTSDVLSEHITVTQTSRSLLTSTQTLNVRADERESLSLLAMKKKTTAICGKDTRP